MGERFTGERVPPGSTSEGAPDLSVQGGAGQFTPDVPGGDGRGEIDKNSVRCAICNAFIKDSTAVKRCWNCQQTNFLGQP